MATLLERIQAVVTLDPETHGDLWFAAVPKGFKSSLPIAPADVAEIVTALESAGQLVGYDALNAEIVSECNALRIDLSATRSAVAEAQSTADGLLKDVCNLEIERDNAKRQLAEVDADRESWRLLAGERMDERDALRAQVAEMGSGEPVAWLVFTAEGKVSFAFDTEQEADEDWPNQKATPVFRATNHAQAAELADVREARDAWQAIAEQRAADLKSAKAATAAASTGLDEWRKRALRVEGERDDVRGKLEDARAETRTVQSLYESEKLARGNTHRALGNAIADRSALQARVETLLSGEYLAANALAAARLEIESLTTERDSWQLSHGTVSAEKKAAEARVKVLEGDADPVAWMITLQNGHVYPSPHKTDVTNVVAAVEPLYRRPPKTGDPVAWLSRTPGVSKWLSFDKSPLASTPLYEAPPPAAIGVTDERCVVLEVDRLRTVNTKGPDHLIGSRAQAEERAKALHGTAYRLVQIDAPTVDVDAIRKALSPDRNWVPTIVRAEILAAIGDR